MNIRPDKSSREWRVLVDNLKIYMIELDMNKSDEEIDNYAIYAFENFGTGEIPNPVQGMRLILKSHPELDERFEKYLTNSKRQDNLRWRVKSLPPNVQEHIK